jgi:drug/metabolite transporter (DMT)-like permease
LGLTPFVVRDLHLLWNSANLGFLLVLGVVTFLAAIADFEALKKGKLSVIEIVMTLELPVTVVLALAFLQESLSLVQSVMIGAVFLGVLLIATEKRTHFKEFVRGLEKGVALAIVGAIGMGLTNFLTGSSAKNISPILAIWGPWLVFTMMCLFVIETRRGGVKTFAHHWRHYRWLILFTGLFDTAAWLLYAFALEGKEIALTTAITESYPAVALFLGLWLNKEKIHWHQYCGAALALGASIGLGFFI